MSKYTGTRIVPKHCGVWDKTKTYENLSIVLYEDTGDSYISRKAVPKNTDISDEEYWALSAKFSAQLGEIESGTNKGTITGVTVSSPLTGGGTSGSVSIGAESFSNLAGSYGESSDKKPAFGESFSTIHEQVDKYGRTTSISANSVTIPSTEASAKTAGLMSSDDKTKLDNISGYLLVSAETIQLSPGSTLSSGSSVTLSHSYTVNENADLTLAFTCYADCCTVRDLTASNGTLSATLVNVSSSSYKCTASIAVLQFMKID